jgi:trehalose 6-phosphate synthase
MKASTNSSRTTAAVADRVIVLANRAPFRHEHSRGGIVASRSASGLVTALEPLLEASSGTWVAHAAGSADSAVVDRLGGIDVPPANPQYRVRYVPLSDDVFRGYYCGFANEGLWPLCHRVDVTPVFRRADYEMYRAANTRFGAVVADEAGDGAPIVLVQGYHFALAPRMLRERMPHARVVAFWHIPWPRCRTFVTCPWAVELVDGLLGSDITGFQTDDDCLNFLNCVDALLPDAFVDIQQGTIKYQGRITTVRAYPVGVDCEHEALRSAPSIAACREWAGERLGLPRDTRLGVGVDRMDYTKGITDKFLAIERLLEQRPELIGKFAFVQIAEPSRDCLAAYRHARDQAFETCRRINARFGGSPIRFIEEHHEPDAVYRYYRAADFCYVASLRDGMNLVAKEFVAARDDDRGVLVLSEFAGAAQQLRAALLVNPLKHEQAANAMAQALDMSSIEQAKRMRVLRADVAAFDGSWWATQMLHDAIHGIAACDRSAEELRWSAAVA